MSTSSYSSRSLFSNFIIHCQYTALYCVFLIIHTNGNYSDLIELVKYFLNSTERFFFVFFAFGAELQFISGCNSTIFSLLSVKISAQKEKIVTSSLLKMATHTLCIYFFIKKFFFYCLHKAPFLNSSLGECTHKLNRS